MQCHSLTKGCSGLINSPLSPGLVGWVEQGETQHQRLASTELAGQTSDVPQRPDGDFFMHRVRVLPWIDDPEPVQVQGFNSSPH